jgi:hypothetical protein
MWRITRGSYFGTRDRPHDHRLIARRAEFSATAVFDNTADHQNPIDEDPQGQAGHHEEPDQHDHEHGAQEHETKLYRPDCGRPDVKPADTEYAEENLQQSSR